MEPKFILISTTGGDVYLNVLLIESITKNHEKPQIDIKTTSGAIHYVLLSEDKSIKLIESTFNFDIT
jgi:hypothetical protein